MLEKKGKKTICFETFADVHLHSYCRLFFQSRVYNTNFSEICPQGCEHESHVISDSVVVQLSKTPKLIYMYDLTCDSLDLSNASICPA